MKKTDLARGNEIQSEIRQLNEQLEKWQQAEKLKQSSFVNLSSADDYCTIPVRAHYIDFEEMKSSAISAIKKELTELTTEFESL